MLRSLHRRLPEPLSCCPIRESEEMSVRRRYAASINKKMLKDTCGHVGGDAQPPTQRTRRTAESVEAASPVPWPVQRMQNFHNPSVHVDVQISRITAHNIQVISPDMRGVQDIRSGRLRTQKDSRVALRPCCGSRSGRPAGPEQCKQQGRSTRRPRLFVIQARMLREGRIPVGIHENMPNPRTSTNSMRRLSPTEALLVV